VKELKAIKKTYDQNHHYILQTLNDVRFGRGINVVSAKTMARGMTEGIIQNENALVLLSLLKQHDEYTVRHSINVCILSLLLAKHLGLDESAMQTLGMGALLHDIGKMRLPIEILNKPDKLSAGELVVVQRHPDVGYELLRNKKGLPPASLEIVRSHHERINGSGYPRKLKGDEITLFARIVSIVDIYDAITTDRSYHDGISPHEAIRLIYENEKDAFPPELLELFIQCLSIFPIGSIVELENGEIGIVMNVNRNKHLLPVVLLVMNRDKIPYFPRKVCNLELLSDQGQAVHIKRILESSAYGINTSNILFEEGDFNSLDLNQQLPAIEPEYREQVTP
jgi:putative nucleotidyltransferase with HDIG domain